MPTRGVAGPSCNLCPSGSTPRGTPEQGCRTAEGEKGVQKLPPDRVTSQIPQLYSSCSRTALLPRSTCAGTRAAGLQPVSLPTKSIQMAEILPRGLLPYPSSWPGCSAVQSNHSPGPKQPCCQRLATRTQIPPLQQHLAKVAPRTRTVGVRTVTAVIPQGRPYSSVTFHQVLGRCSIPNSVPAWAWLAGSSGAAVADTLQGIA